jgi:diketogulonate reductase-like aldo/keto reductase
MMIMNLTISSTVRLNNGVEMPSFGLGTFRSEKGLPTQNAVRWALEAGYRHVDTAAAYGNEEDVGIALRQSGIDRHQVFVVTKVWNDNQGYDSTLRAFDASLERLGLEYVDLYLIHWPVTKLRGQTWKALEKLYEQGKCRAIGVSNYMIRHLKELLAESPIVPAVNQVEFSPFLYRKELLDYCRVKGIQLEAYSPLSRGRKLGDPRLAAIAARYGKTPAQVAIRWALQHELVVIPKSIHRERILENAQVFNFEITAEDMQALDALNENYSVIQPDWDPETSPNWA